jgi:hypothetical protein
MSIQILLEPDSKNNKSLDLYCNSLEANEYKVNTLDVTTIDAVAITTGTLTVANVGYPTTALPSGHTVMSGSGSSIGFAVSPHLMAGVPVIYNIPAIIGDGLDVAGGLTGQVFQSSSTIHYGDNLRYNYKVCGLMTSTQPFTGYYLKLGGVIINQIPTVNYIMNLVSEYVEISGSFTITSGFPLATTMTCNMTVSFTPEYVSGAITPVSPVVVSNTVTNLVGYNFGLNPKFSIAVGSSGGTTTFQNTDSVLQCSYSPINP